MTRQLFLMNCDDPYVKLYIIKYNLDVSLLFRLQLVWYYCDSILKYKKITSNIKELFGIIIKSGLVG